MSDDAYAAARREELERRLAMRALGPGALWALIEPAIAWLQLWGWDGETAESLKETIANIEDGMDGG